MEIRGHSCPRISDAIDRRKDAMGIRGQRCPQILDVTIGRTDVVIRRTAAVNGRTDAVSAWFDGSRIPGHECPRIL